MFTSKSQMPLSNDSNRSHFRLGRILVAALFCLLSIANAEAADVVNNLSFDLYSQEHGLSNNQIHCILQDSKGWMWMGTSQGICRFDGYRFTVFKNDPDDSTSLKGNLVRVIYEDHKGQLWVGTENGGLNKFDRGSENFIHLFYKNQPSLLKDVTVASLLEDKNGVLWIGTESSLFRLEGEKKLTSVVPSNLSSFKEFVRVIKTDRSGRMWIGTNRGVFLYHP